MENLDAFLNSFKGNLTYVYSSSTNYSSYAIMKTIIILLVLIICLPVDAEKLERTKAMEVEKKRAVANKLKELEEQWRTQMKEKEQKVKEHFNKYPLLQKHVEPFVNENGEHELVIILYDNADRNEVEREVKLANGRFDDKLRIEELKMFSISVPTSNSQALFDKLKMHPKIKSVDFNYPVEMNKSEVTPSPPR